MRCVAKDELVVGVKPAGPFPDHLHIAKPGLEGSLHVDMAPFLNGCPLSPACTAQKSLRQIAKCRQRGASWSRTAQTANL